MAMNTIQYTPIGIVRSPFTEIAGMPIQPPAAQGVRGSIILKNEFSAGLKDVEGFSHLILIYHLHLVRDFSLSVKPFLDNDEHGIFATRAPKRPNPIGLSVVRLVARDEATLEIENVDILDGTPLLDLKPYVPHFDAPDNVRIGWFEGRLKQIDQARSDDRFS
jgi:tRNA-Thr(GGU) m(6)t(6)A37 methyltransferase TsaA